METAVKSLGYKSEGDAATVLPTQSPLTIPFYRLFSKSAKDHFYTTNETERDIAANDLKYTYEEIAAYV